MVYRFKSSLIRDTNTISRVIIQGCHLYIVFNDGTETLDLGYDNPEEAYASLNKLEKALKNKLKPLPNLMFIIYVLAALTFSTYSIWFPYLTH
jgi:hypothetical protein